MITPFVLLAGFLTLLSPCAIPLIPLIFTVNTNKSKHTFIVVFSFIISQLFLTFILYKVVEFSYIPTRVLSLISFFAIALLTLPIIFEKLTLSKIYLPRTTNKFLKNIKETSKPRSILIGLAIGPIFASCSPVYGYIITTLLPVDFNQALYYGLIYYIGLGLAFLLLILTYNKLYKRFRNLKFLYYLNKVMAILVLTISIFNIWIPTQSTIARFSKFNFKSINELSSRALPSFEVKRKVSLDFLKGDFVNMEPIKAPKYYLVDFWTYSCVDCIRTIPFLNALKERYSPVGLSVIGVHTPEFIFEENSGNLTRAIKELEVNYPVYIDNNKAVWNAFGNHYWPAHYLLDSEGNVLDTFIGEGNYFAIEERLDGLLNVKYAKNGIKEPDFISSVTPEIYLGARRSQLGSNSEGYSLGRQSFKKPGNIPLNTYALEGNYLIDDEKITSLQDSFIYLNYHSTNLYMVAGSDSKKDILLDKKIVEISDFKLYPLIEDTNNNDRLVKIFIPKGVSIYTFTFGLK